MFDLDRSGSINMHEFASLYKYINDWKSLFERIDRDRSGYIEEEELRQGNFMMCVCVEKKMREFKSKVLEVY